ncbi:MAG: HAD family hydrolase [Pelagibacteraceae bacterium]|jgi:2-phosphoglycolate phosphatase
MLDPSIKAVLFDFDGTFGDTAPDLVNTANYIFNKHKKDPIDFSSGRQIASDGVKAFLDKRFDESKDDYKSLFDQFLNYYDQHLNDNFKLFEGIKKLIDYLDKKEISWGIVTNKSRRLTEKLLKFNDLYNQCSVLVCGDDGLKPKPYPDTLLHALKSLGIKCHEALYLGDGYRDIQAAKNANIKSILVTYGYLKEEDKYHDWGASYIINHPVDLIYS